MHPVTDFRGDNEVITNLLKLGIKTKTLKLFNGPTKIHL